MNPRDRSSTILITGADGFVGSYLTEAMVRQGSKVRAEESSLNKSDHDLSIIFPMNLSQRIGPPKYRPKESKLWALRKNL